MTLTDVVSPRAEIEDHEGNVINKKTEKFKGKTNNHNPMPVCEEIELHFLAIK